MNISYVTPIDKYVVVVRRLNKCKFLCVGDKILTLDFNEVKKVVQGLNNSEVDQISPYIQQAYAFEVKKEDVKFLQNRDNVNDFVRNRLDIDGKKVEIPYNVCSKYLKLMKENGGLKI